MKTFIFEGHSDDIIIVNNEEYYGMKPFILTNPDTNEKMRIIPIYDGCWSFAVSIYDEDYELPDWKISHYCSGYVTAIIVEAPEETTMERAK